MQAAAGWREGMQNSGYERLLRGQHAAYKAQHTWKHALASEKHTPRGQTPQQDGQRHRARMNVAQISMLVARAFGLALVICVHFVAARGSSICNATSSDPAGQEAALRNIYSELGGDGWGFKRAWLDSSVACGSVPVRAGPPTGKPAVTN
eukprot:1158510-Pelagomonas_calceolata.AAC.4